jgi:hypothetical protein
MPGSNRHAYLFDPEAHGNEVFYGMEQIGWDGLSKPREMCSGVLSARPSLPQPSEATEVADAGGAGIDVLSGQLPQAPRGDRAHDGPRRRRSRGSQ